MRIPSGSTDRTLTFVAVDSTDLKTRKTGLSSFTVYRSRNGGAATIYTTPTVAELSAANMPGVYTLLLDEDTTLTAGHDDEEYVVHITQASMAPVTRSIDIYRPKFTEGQTGAMASNGVTVNALNADVITAASIAAGAITSSEAPALANLDAAITSRMATYTQPTGFLAATFPTGTIANTTNITAGTITTATNVTAVNGLAAGVITAASIAADAITDAKVAADVTIASVTGAVGSVTGAVGSVTGNVGGNVTGSVGSVTAAVTVGTINANVITAASIAAGGLNGKGNWNIGKTGYSLTQTFPTNFSALSITAGGLVDIAQAAAIKAKTDLIPASPAAVGDAMTLTSSERITIAGVIGTTAQTESYRAEGATGSLAQMLYETIGHLGESSISGTTKTVKKIDGITVAETFSLDSATTPTSITRST